MKDLMNPPAILYRNFIIQTKFFFCPLSFFRTHLFHSFSVVRKQWISRCKSGNIKCHKREQSYTDYKNHQFFSIIQHSFASHNTSPFCLSIRGSGIGTAANSALVYSCSGWAKISCVLPSSTSFP